MAKLRVTPLFIRFSENPRLLANIGNRSIDSPVCCDALVEMNQPKGGFMRCRYVLLFVLWILWREIYVTTNTGNTATMSSSWSYEAAYETQSACTQGLYDRVSDTRKNLDPSIKLLPSDKTHVKYIPVEGLTIEAVFHCVPDTVDPRPHK